jgi:hypothetical protein
MEARGWWRMFLWGIGSESDGPVGGPEWTADAGWHAMVSIDVVEPDVETECDGGQVFC